jgi:hypothetical protein
MCDVLWVWRPFDTAGICVAVILGLIAAFFFWWGLSSPLWIEFDQEGVQVKHWNQLNEYLWKDLRLMLFKQTTNVRGIENTYQFAKFRTKAGDWFQIRVNANEGSILYGLGKMKDIMLQAWGTE